MPDEAPAGPGPTQENDRHRLGCLPHRFCFVSEAMNVREYRRHLRIGPCGSGPTDHGGIAQLVERQLCKLEVTGSNPVASTNATGRVAQLVRARP